LCAAPVLRPDPSAQRRSARHRRNDARKRKPAARKPLCADNNGFSLHAAVRCVADDRQALEQL